MFRAQEADPTWKELTNSYIKAATKEFEENIKRLEADMVEAHSMEGLRSRFDERVALEYNQYAWLVANTSGDFDKAFARSRQSLELHPLRNLSTFQDTLARCYYAKGDFQNAVKFQRLAVKQEPHSPTMRRQLALFENAVKADAKPESSPSKEQNPSK
jgi:tetratricopeptide (TPR) repeat protein